MTSDAQRAAGLVWRLARAGRVEAALFYRGWQDGARREPGGRDGRPLVRFCADFGEEPGPDINLAGDRPLLPPMRATAPQPRRQPWSRRPSIRACC